MPKERRSRGSTRGAPYDVDNPMNWTIPELKAKLGDLGINITGNVPKTILRQLYTDNKNNNRDTIPVPRLEPRTVSEPGDRTLSSAVDRLDTNPTSQPNIRGSDTSTNAERDTFHSNNYDMTANNAASNNNIGQLTDYILRRGDLAQSQNTAGGVVTDARHPRMSTTGCVLGYMAGAEVEPLSKTKHTLASYYARVGYAPSDLRQPAFQPDFHRLASVSGLNGVPAGELPRLDLVSENIRKQIIDGKDVNLATLLIPNYDVPAHTTLTSEGVSLQIKGQRDQRLDRSLTIDEFEVAFDKYRRIMCHAFPQRRDELELYKQDIRDIYNCYGIKFYEYHKLFSRIAAEALAHWGIKVDWAQRHEKLLNRITAGHRVNACDYCHSVDHFSNFCDLQFTSKPDTTQQNHLNVKGNKRQLDRYGRARQEFNGREVCNHFNGDLGCTRQACPHIHVCSICKSNTHGKSQCVRLLKRTNNSANNSSPKSQVSTSNTGNTSRSVINQDGTGRKQCLLSDEQFRASTPININRLRFELIDHPDQEFVNYLCEGLEFGFDTMVSKTDLPTKECKNLLSARRQPHIVDDLLQRECEKGYMLGPFPEPPFTRYRVSPLGIAEGKYSKKKRLIIDLSSPHDNMEHDSINSLINGQVSKTSAKCQHDAYPVSQLLQRNLALKDTVDRLWQGAVATKTLDTYSTGMKTYCKFLSHNNVIWQHNNIPPVSEDLLIYFVAHCVTVLKIRYCTIKLYLAGIRYHYIRNGQLDPLQTCFGQPLQRLVTILKSVKKMQGPKTFVRLPITYDILCKIHHALMPSSAYSFTSLLIDTVCITAYFAFLRCGEFTITDSFDANVNLCIGDLRFSDDCAFLTLKSSKTDLFRQGITIRLFKTHKAICPYNALKTYLRKRNNFPCSDSDPLFILANGHALTRKFLAKPKRNTGPVRRGQ